MKSYTTITVEHQDSIALLTFNRPRVLNALNTEVISEALDAVRALGEDRAVRVLVLTGAGRAFVAGADIAEMFDKTPQEARVYSELGHSLMSTIQNLGKPVIAAVNGFCLGGGMEVALACDIRIASEKAQFGLPETILGIIPGWGATQRAARLLGPSLAKELIFTGKRVGARRALEIGLVNRVVHPAGLMSCTLEMARGICRQGQLALAQAKRVITEGLDQPLPDGLGLEIDAFESLFETADRKEGMRAFIEKRKPDFRGS
ncbi:enoyl-CoA hydratase/isomerase family protein [Thermodesulfobacteriota bacterium]